MEGDARIRLEGRLETVEQAALEAERALDGLKRNEWGPAAQVLEVDPRDAVTAVRAMALQEPSLRPALAWFERARRRLDRAIAAKAKERGLPEALPREQLRSLIADTVLFEEKLRNPMPALSVPLYGALVLVVLMERHQPLGLVFPAMIGAFLSLLVVSYGGATTVLVTSDRLVVGREVVKLLDLVSVTTSVRTGGSPRPYALTLEMKTWLRTVRLPWIPQGLITALSERGITVVRHEWPYEPNRLSRL